MMKSKTKTKVKLVALANLLLASCWGWSCTTDMRDAVWSGALDYLTGTTSTILECGFSAEGCFAAEE